MEKEKEKPTENTIEKVGSSLVWTAKVTCLVADFNLALSDLKSRTNQ